MTDPIQPGDASLGETDVRVMVPRVRRAIEGAGRAAVLLDDSIKDLVADAMASLILHTGGVFGKMLLVTDYTLDTFGNQIPSEYATDISLRLDEQTAVAAQAALDFFFFEWGGIKTSEQIADEAQRWEWEISPMLLKAELDLLVATRDAALQAISDRGVGLDTYTNYLTQRDIQTARLVETWSVFDTGGYALTQDYRFGTVA